MRAYLLGQLPDDQATALEQEYFVNRAFLLRVQSEETALIADYLGGNLPPSEKRYFEGRYLQVPELRRRVEEVRRTGLGAHPTALPRSQAVWRAAFAAAAALLIGFTVWIYRSHQTGQPQQIVGERPPGADPVAVIHLSPGLAKGHGAKAVQFDQPASSMTSLILELPERKSPIRCDVRISMINADGSQAPLWNSPEPAISAGNGEGQTLTLFLSSTLFHPGDYLVEAWTPDGAVRETYVYRVRTAP